MHQLLCLLCPDFPSSLIYLAITIIDTKNTELYPFTKLTDIVLNVFLYWDILQHIQMLFQSKTKPNNNEQKNSKHTDYLFIGEIRTSIFQYQLQNPTKKPLCTNILSKLKSSNKLTLLDFCKTITIK
eukprot:452547_1